MLGMMVEAKLIWVLELSIVRGVTRVARAPPWGGGPRTLGCFDFGPGLLQERERKREASG